MLNVMPDQMLLKKLMITIEIEKNTFDLHVLKITFNLPRMDIHKAQSLRDKPPSS